MNNHHVIYLPGLGNNHFGDAQDKLLKYWRVYGFQTHYHPIVWADGEAFTPKLERILKSINDYKAKGALVSLIGTSAGASAAINAFVKRKDMVHRVICICGKLQNPQTVPETRFKQNPAFKDSLALLSDSLTELGASDLNKILSIRPLRDGVVPPSDTIIEDAHASLLPTAGHGFSIFYALTFGSYRSARFIKK